MNKIIFPEITNESYEIKGALILTNDVVVVIDLDINVDAEKQPEGKITISNDEIEET